MRKLKPLKQEEFNMEIVEDLGSVPTPNGKTNRRYAMFRCNTCKVPFKARASGRVIRAQKQCLDCRRTSTRGTSHSLYRVWNGIRQRCYTKTRKDYKRYGGVGVTMADVWKDNPSAFIEWCEENGWEQGLQVDKDIKCRELSISPAIYAPHTISFITPSENIVEAKGRKVNQYTLNWEFIREFPSLADASEFLGRTRSNTLGVQYACTGVYKQSGGFKWKYADK